MLVYIAKEGNRSHKHLILNKLILTGNVCILILPNLFLFQLFLLIIFAVLDRNLF